MNARTLVLALVSLANATAAQSPSFSDQTAGAQIASTYQPSAFTHANYCGGGAAADFNRDGW